MVTSSPPLAAATATPSQKAVPAQLGKRTGPSHRPMPSRRMTKPFWRLSRPDFRAETSHSKIFGRATSGWDCHRLEQRSGHSGIPLRPPSTSGLATRMEPFWDFQTEDRRGVSCEVPSYSSGAQHGKTLFILQVGCGFLHCGHEGLAGCRIIFSLSTRLSGCLLLMERDSRTQHSHKLVVAIAVLQQDLDDRLRTRSLSGTSQTPAGMLRLRHFGERQVTQQIKGVMCRHSSGAVHVVRPSPSSPLLKFQPAGTSQQPGAKQEPWKFDLV